MSLACPKCGGKIVIRSTSTYKEMFYKTWKCKACDYRRSLYAESLEGLTNEQQFEMAKAVQRKDGPSCERCREWRGLESANPCGMGFPDPVIEGVGFARDCSLYVVG